MDDDRHNGARPGRRLTRRGMLRACAAAAVAGPMAGVTYTVGMEPVWVEVVRRELPILELDDAMVGKTLAMISDMHVGPFVDDSYLRGAMRQVAALKPDMLVLTGDLITLEDGDEVERCGDILSELGRPPLGAFATLGNHDYGPFRRQPELAAALGRAVEANGMIMLRNAYVDVEGLRLAGMDDLWSERFIPQHVTPALRGGRSSLALSHNPDSVDEEGWNDYRGWVLCGHTHGGQVRLPWGGGAPILPVKNHAYVAGEVKARSGRRVYINRGLGYMHRVRFNARPEITLFTLTRP